MKNVLSLLIICICFLSASAQEKVFETFKDTKVINTHSVETLRKGHMDVRISHRFGDAAGDNGGWPTFYGLEVATDVGIGVEYGLTDRTMIGLHRTKGAGPLKQNVHGLMKIRIMQQTKGKNLLGLTVMGLGSYSTMQKSNSDGVLHFFEKGAHRMSYNLSIILSRKFSHRFSIQAHAGYTYRNLVSSIDKNDLVSIGFATRIQMTKALGFIFDGNFPFSDIRISENSYFPATGFGLEWETGGGHVFQLNFTNSKGLMETDYLPYTQSDWGKGEYRIGFTISRQFKV